MEILSHTGDQSHAGVKAGQHKDGRKQHQPRLAEQSLGQRGQHLGTGGKTGYGGTGQCAGMPQHGVNGQQQHARHKAGTDGAALHILLPVNALRPDVHGDDRAKVQRRKGVHGLVAVQDALYDHGGTIRLGGRTVLCRQRMQQTAAEQDRDQHQQAGAEQPAQPAGEPVRVQRNQKSRPEKQHGIPQLYPGAAAQQRGEHGKRGACGARNGQTRPDGQVDQDHEHLCEHRVHPPGQLIQTVGACHRDDPRNGQSHGADGKPQKGKPEVYPCLCTQIGREDQVARPEKHGK